MSDIAVRVSGLSKKFEIGTTKQKYKTLRDDLAQQFKSLAKPFWGKPKDLNAEPEDASTFWALKDINFEIKKGEVVGFIGRNGAGKSTLLKILSRITEPTTGTVEIFGRVASLLEVGTGFHNELTGRENVFLNGAILGMKRIEIARKFDEIVAFSEIEKFIDTPVKHYSSGMYMRLAFAIAAHLEPEILIIDEVLAVGDAEFQKKCLGRMRDASQEGRTVLFVSHNLAAVQELTQKCILLSNGTLEMSGQTADVIERYQEHTHTQAKAFYDLTHHPRFSPNFKREVALLSCKFEGAIKDELKRFSHDEVIKIQITVKGTEEVKGFRFGMTVFNLESQSVGTFFTNAELSIANSDTKKYRIYFQNHRLAPGQYFFAFSAGQTLCQAGSGWYGFDGVTDVLFFEILPFDYEKNGSKKWEKVYGRIVFETPVVEVV